MPDSTRKRYFPYSIQISRSGWEKIAEDRTVFSAEARSEPAIIMYRRIAAVSGKYAAAGAPVTGGELNLFGLLNTIYRYIIYRYQQEQNPKVLERGATAVGFPAESDRLDRIASAFATHYPPFVAEAPLFGSLDPDTCLCELLILRINGDNPALNAFGYLFSDAELASEVPSRSLADGLEAFLSTEPAVARLGLSLPEVLRAPIKASPNSLSGQIEFIRRYWQGLLPPELSAELLTALDILGEEERHFFKGAGPPQVLEFSAAIRPGSLDYPEYERFSPDADWMANVVMVAKMTYVWLDQLAKQYRRPVERLDQIPDEELDRLSRWGFSALWLIGIWERSPASRTIKHIGGNPDAISSAYSLYDYTIAADLGGEEALQVLKEKCRKRGIRLASDMVPNHTGIYSKWILEHPEWFIQLDYPPYPAYRFSGPDLSQSSDVTIQVEDGYWDRRDAAVVFRHHHHRTGHTRYIYHGNDGTSTPWNDTAQLNYLLPEVREAVIQTILHVARQFPVIRFDAAMTLAKKHYQRLWFPQPGHGSGIPSRAEHGLTREQFDAAMPEEFWREVVDRVAVEAPGTLLLAEAFWLMEGYFVRTLGMHRVYNSAFMNMLKLEENAKYRQTVKNVLEFEPEVLKRFVNFMNNPDERTAVEQFGKEGKYFGACVLLVTMPGLPMIGHGQIEGFHEKYGMEYRRAYWDEPVDEHLVHLHERYIFPLMRRRHIFSGSRHFALYDFFAGDHVNEDVFAYSNRAEADRGLIIYHNRFASTSGWIRMSAAMTEKTGGGDGRLVQKSLGEALGLNQELEVYYSFRDYAAGLFYLRSGRELSERGLFVELGAYQYYAFLDFTEIRDDQFGSWGRLCARLNGRPVPDLNEEMKQVKYSGLIDRYKALIGILTQRVRALFDPRAEEPYREETLQLVRAEVAGLGTAFEQAGMPVEPEFSAAVVVRGLEALAGRFVLAEPAPKPLPERTEMPPGPFGGECETGLLMVCCVLQAFSAVKAASEIAWLNDFGLDRATDQLLHDLECGREERIENHVRVPLVRLILRHGETLSPWNEREGDRGAQLFEDPGVREFIFVHESKEELWFSKERWELLLTWLSIAATVVEAMNSGEQRRVAAVAEAAGNAARELSTQAARGGYRVSAFTKTMTQPAPGTESGR